MMSTSLSQAEKKQEFLKEHDRLAHLFVTDRFAFELERKRIINKTIDEMRCSEAAREKMRRQQKDLDRVLKGAGSAENRLAMIQALFWHHVVNRWQPALQEFLTATSWVKNSKGRRPTLYQVKKSMH